jgi:chromosome segregation protein
LRLTQIKLAGFKSFVDPTHIPVPGQLVGVVGPNGCGKSNIIDAVRWVLGESSARHLRGETMQDVLFNGAGSRQPVNRASVELEFDNSLGRAAGQWSTYAEISVKRVLEREGESSYFINNTHVRRRDVADIFLGTGLGARAYAIIEQGMISRIIEAKPEDLRVFLEEAAGVSKYRDRRRETELRLSDTRENLVRVEDIRQELGKQLEHLQGQAEVAMRYNALQGELATTQNLLWYVRRRDAAAQRERHGREIERITNEVEAETARLRESESRLEELRSRHFAAGDEVHTAQGALYESNAEVARLEQQIQHVRENRQRVESQLAGLTAEQEQGGRESAANESSRADWQQALTSALAREAELRERLEAARAELPRAEEAFRASQSRRDGLQRVLAEARQSREVAQTRLEHAARILEQLQARGDRLREEQGALSLPDSDEIARVRDAAAEGDRELAERREALARAEGEVPRLEQALRERQTEIEAAAQQVTALESRRDALRQIQERIAHSEKLQGWLVAHGLDASPRLWQAIEIEAGWEDALEAVLRERLNGLRVADLASTRGWLDEVPPGKVTVFAPPAECGAAEVAAAGLTPLASLVRCAQPEIAAVLGEWLFHVYVLRDAAEGLARAAELPRGAMLVTRAGHVFTRHSVSFHAPDSELHGVLSRQREIEQLAGEIAAAGDHEGALRAVALQSEASLDERKRMLATQRADIAERQERQHERELDLLRLTEQAQRVTQRGAQISEELAEIGREQERELGQRAAAEDDLARLAGSIEQANAALEQAAAEYQAAEAALGAQREAVGAAERELQTASFQAQSCRGKLDELAQAAARIAETMARVGATVARLAADAAQLDEAPWVAQLEQALTVRQGREQALAAARDALELADSELRQTEQERLAVESRVGPLRERINELRLKEQEARLTEEQYAQQLAEAGADEAALAGLLERGQRAGALQQEITRLQGEIAALGAVNLAAVEELKASTERKAYLDAQSQDLTEAMTTLEDAIRRIDRETRERLQHTFDEVNRHFGEMFPSLFGGGTARLELTGEEILDAGVQVFAQPPGKRNSSIHLLSGGEKALTAMSLVFSLFQLNPAPFCLLDEVDAPLDDTNTERFCALVKKMSGSSQFVFISHNKITMEIASQLIGVTMPEAGVSRVVAVDIEEAMKLADKAA